MEHTCLDAHFLILAKLCAFYGVAIGDLLEYDPNEKGVFDLVAA
jgi:DNA-binding Xre family transcriptional regulator